MYKLLYLDGLRTLTREGALIGALMSLFALVLAMALWGSTFVVLKLVFVELDPLWVVCARMWVASVVLLCVRRWWGEASYEAGDGRLIAAMSLAEPCLYFILEAEALRYTSASQAGMITATLPVLTVGGAVLFLGEKASARLLVGLSVAFTGVMWLSLDAQGSESAPNPLLGNTLELVAMLCAAVYSLSVKRLAARYSPLWLTSIQAISGALFFLPLALIYAPLPVQLSLKAVAGTLYLGLGVTLGAYGLYNFAMMRLPASRVAVFGNLISLFSLLMAMVCLGERLTLSQWFASALILCGVVMSQLDKRPLNSVEAT